MAAPMKTPGVYVVEKNAFPNAVVEVATAVPAFIGYTEVAEQAGRDLTNTPYRITSLAQFIKYFGEGPASQFTMTATPPPKAGTPPPEAPAEPPPGTNFNYKGTKCNLEQKSNLYNLYNSIRLFYQNSGGPCYIVSVGDYTKKIAGADLSAGITPLIKEQEPTILVIPESVTLVQADCQSVQQAMLTHCGGVMKNRFAILDVLDGSKSLEEVNKESPPVNCIDALRNYIGTNYMAYGSAYYPWLNTSVVQPAEVAYANLDEAGLTALDTAIKAELIPPPAEPADGKTAPPPTDAEKQREDQITKLLADMTAKDRTSVEQSITHNSLLTISGLYQMTMNELQSSLNLLPPGAAMAGVYTMVDNQIGVWKAPANVSLNSVISPAVDISFEQQQDLNVPIDGKAVNAIRAFIGEGVLVWGARTLDGNSLDWRYINVRRTMIMLEESIRLASKAYVFEPNTASTWVTMKSMIGNFLNGVWKQGGLVGTTAAEAYSVDIGLGTTMDSEDILNGILKVSVLVAVSRPAEFIEITFQQQMQKS
ncbi:MAG: phage tail sheath protein FI [Phenylobacterium sp.]|jgi:phage tail sheath protein FI